MVIGVPPGHKGRIGHHDHTHFIGQTLVGRRVEVRVSQTEVTAVALDTGEVTCRHQRSLARHRTITDLAHARALKAGRTDEPVVEIRPLARYDALIA